MLYILYGLDQAGKKTVRDVIAENYGVKIIGKYIYEEGDTSFYDKGQKLRLRGYSYFDTEEKAYSDTEIEVLARDAFLVFPNSTDKEQIKREKEQNNLNSYANQKKLFIYSREKKTIDGEVRTINYVIKKSEVEFALKDTKNNYLLVCSDSDTIKAISQISCHQRPEYILVMGHVGGSTSRSETWSDDDRKKIADWFGTDKIKKFTAIIYNKHIEGVSGIDDVIKKYICDQWEFITSMTKCKPSYADGTDVEKMDIFYIGPFGVPEKELIIGDNKYKSRCYDDKEELKAIYGVNPYEKIFELIQGCIQDGKEDIVNCHAVSPNYSRKGGYNSLTQEIMNQIACADVVIVNLSECRPNCYWELGYAHALNKTVIALIDEIQVKAIAFDLNDIPCFTYKIEENGALKIIINNLNVDGKAQGNNFDKYRNTIISGWEKRHLTSKYNEKIISKQFK